MSHFVIESEYGDFKAGSEDMARLRIAEIASIAALVEISSSGMFADALAKAVVGKVETAAKVVENPEAAAKGVGRGLKGLFGKAKKATVEAVEKEEEKDSEAVSDESVKLPRAVDEAVPQQPPNKK